MRSQKLFRWCVAPLILISNSPYAAQIREGINSTRSFKIVLRTAELKAAAMRIKYGASRPKDVSPAARGIYSLATTVAPLILFFNCFLLAGCRAQTVTDPHNNSSASVPTLITGINTAQFFKAVGMTSTYTSSISPLGINYFYNNSNNGITDVSIGVFPSVQLAKTAYDVPIIAARIADSEIHHISTKGIGDRFRCLYSPAYPSAGITSPSGRFHLMRCNVIIDVEWEGSYEEGIRFARKIDRVLQTSQVACPRGTNVPVPVVDFDMPRFTFFPTAQNTRKIQYHTEDGTRIYTDAAADQGAKSSGSITPDSRAPQKTHGILQCATLTNVMFTSSY